jgi:hypothetical protein
VRPQFLAQEKARTCAIALYATVDVQDLRLRALPFGDLSCPEEAEIH